MLENSELTAKLFLAWIPKVGGCGHQGQDYWGPIHRPRWTPSNWPRRFSQSRALNHDITFIQPITMSTSIQPVRPLAGLKQALRQCRAERQRCRTYATSPIAEEIPKEREIYPSLMPKNFLQPPSKGFRPSVATKQNREPFLSPD